MKLKFTKMHGAGNDFVVIDAIHQQIDFTPEQWRRLADRRFGVGADQMLVVVAAADPDAIVERLGTDPMLGPLVRAAPGRRIPGHPDPAELAASGATAAGSATWGA